MTLAHDEKCEWALYVNEWCGCAELALAQAQEEIARLKEREDCHDPLDPCRGCLVCFEGMWNTEVRRREAGDDATRRLERERDALRAALRALNNAINEAVAGDFIPAWVAQIMGDIQHKHAATIARVQKEQG